MALKKLYVDGVAGLAYVQHPELVFVDIMLVCREGVPMVETDDTPTGNLFRHVSNEGKVELDADIPVTSTIPASTPTTRFASRPEQFYFEYKTN